MNPHSTALYIKLKDFGYNLLLVQYKSSAKEILKWKGVSTWLLSSSMSSCYLHNVLQTSMLNHTNREILYLVSVTLFPLSSKNGEEREMFSEAFNWKDLIPNRASNHHFCKLKPLSIF